MNLVIDIGNTRSKYAFFQEDRLIGVNYRLDSILEDIRVWKEKGETGSENYPDLSLLFCDGSR